MPYDYFKVECSAAKDKDLYLISGVLTESINEIPSYSLVILYNGEVNSLLGSNIKFSLSKDKAPKVPNNISEDNTFARSGIIETVERFKNISFHFDNVDFYLYKIIVAPDIKKLAYTADCKIYQNATVKDIVDDLFGEYKLSREQYKFFIDEPSQITALQFNEDTLNFLQRIFAKHGLNYFVSYSSTGENSLTITNNNRGYEKFENEIRFGNYHASCPLILELHDIYNIAPEKYKLDSINLHAIQNNQSASLEISTKTNLPELLKRQYHPYPPCAREDIETICKTAAKRGTVNQYTMQGKSTYPGFAPGKYFAAKENKYLVTNLVMEFYDPSFMPLLQNGDSNGYNKAFGDFRLITDVGDVNNFVVNEFQCVPFYESFGDVDLCPHNLIPEPEIGPQFATVTESQDDYGRIKIKFPWDKKENEIWAPIAQTFCQGAPTVNTHVLVMFVDNNPAYPIIIAAGPVYTNKVEKSFKDETIIMQRWGENENNEYAGIILDDQKKGKMTINALQGLRINTSKAVIEIDEDGNITIDSKGDIKMGSQTFAAKAKRTIDLDAKAPVSIKGSQVKLG